MTRTLRRMVCLLWEFPQNLLGAIVLGLLRAAGRLGKITCDHERLFIRAPVNVSLGMFIFFSPSRSTAGIDPIMQHEYGHSMQSQLLGPFYLIVVGLPSFFLAAHATWHARKYHRLPKKYLERFPERWAENLGRKASPILQDSARY